MAGLWNREVPHDVREGLFGGRGTVRVWDLAPSPIAPFAAVLACELEAAGSVGMHVQESCDEILVAIEGEGDVQASGRSERFRSGVVIELPVGEMLSISNTSREEPLRYLIVKASRSPYAG